MQEVEGSIPSSSTNDMVQIQNKTLLSIAFIEILIGAVTILTTAYTLVTATNSKAPNVLIFVLLTAAISSSLGAGLLKANKTAYELLIYFSSIIIVSKVLIFADIIQLNGALENSIPAHFKNSVSIFYHGFIVFYLRRQEIKKIFIK